MVANAYLTDLYSLILGSFHRQMIQQECGLGEPMSLLVSRAKGVKHNQQNLLLIFSVASWVVKVEQELELTFHPYLLWKGRFVGIFILMALWLVQMGICWIP